MFNRLWVVMVLILCYSEAMAQSGVIKSTEKPLLYIVDGRQKLIIGQLVAMPGIEAVDEERSVEYSILRQDRHQRIIADVPVLQKELLQEGKAVAYPLTHESAAIFYPLEAEARQKKAGGWKAFKVVDADQADECLQRFCIIEGRVKSIAKQRESVYINFGDDWRTDFTIKLPLKHDIDVDNLPGKLLRVRGWVQEYNGPLIEITNTVLIEII